MSNESRALLRQAQTAMESSVARLKERLRLFAADSLAREEATTRWWARQSEALHTRLELRLIRWRAVRAARRMKREHALTPVEAAEYERELALLLDKSLAEMERHMAPGRRPAEGIQAHQGRATWLPYS
jgi:hypothetical protein